jgi:hypothetical protein
MPNTDRILSAFVPSGNPDTLAVSLALNDEGYAPGQLGGSFDSNDKTYSLVKVDSGATAANAVGAVLANQVAFWKSKTNRIVTNDHRQCLTPTSPASSVAGIFRVAVATPGAGGTLVAILARGHGITVAAGTTAIGAVMADSTASVSRVVTATGILTALGIARTADAASVITMDVDIPTLP